jgi:cytoskeletal protein CcmA (bactofilin family)
MSIWKETTVTKDATATRIPPAPVSEPEVIRPGPAATAVASPAPTVPLAARVDAGAALKESLIAADISIEGKIEGGGSIRVAGKFKGDVNVQGDLIIESGAKLTGSVRADKVTIIGELEGNVEEATLIDLQQTAVVTGDLKSGSLTVASGARLRGQAECGWDTGKVATTAKQGNVRGEEMGFRT